MSLAQCPIAWLLTMARSLATTRITYPHGCMHVVSSVQPSPGAGAVCTALALILHVIDGVDTGVGGPVSGVAAERAVAWCRYLEAHARRLYATVTERVRVAAASRMARGRLSSPFTAREVYRNDWTGLTEPRVVGEALECLRKLGWIRPEAAVARDGYGFF